MAMQRLLTLHWQKNITSCVSTSCANLSLQKKLLSSMDIQALHLIIFLPRARTILNEIADIKAGNWDAQIKANLTGQAVKSGGSPPVDVQVGTHPLSSLPSTQLILSSASSTSRIPRRRKFGFKWRNGDAFIHRRNELPFVLLLYS